MTPDPGILTDLLTKFADAFTLGLGKIHGDAKYLLSSLIVLDLLLAIVLNLSDGDHMKTLVKKTLKYGVFIGIVVFYKEIVNVVLLSFEAVGLKAGGGSISSAVLNDPSEIAAYGIWVTEPIFEFISQLSTIEVLKNLHKIIFTGLTGLMIMLCFFIIGIQIFITYLEFYIVAVLALILVPFGSFKHTSFLGEKAISAVISFGIKLMVLAFVASVAIPLVKAWSIPDNPTNSQIFSLLLGSMALTFLAWHAPGMASSLLSGSPSLSAGSAAGFALAGGVATAGIGMAGSAAAKGTMSAGAQATRAAAGGAGQLAGAYGAGGMGGVAQLGKSAVSNAVGRLADTVRQPFQAGKEHGASTASGGGGGAAGSSTSGSSGQGPGMKASEMMHRLAYVRNSIPPESHKGGSATPNLREGSDT